MTDARGSIFDSAGPPAFATARTFIIDGVTFYVDNSMAQYLLRLSR